MNKSRKRATGADRFTKQIVLVRCRGHSRPCLESASGMNTRCREGHHAHGSSIPSLNGIARLAYTTEVPVVLRDVSNRNYSLRRQPSPGQRG